MRPLILIDELKRKKETVSVDKQHTVMIFVCARVLKHAPIEIRQSVQVQKVMRI